MTEDCHTCGMPFDEWELDADGDCKDCRDEAYGDQPAQEESAEDFHV